MSVVPIPTPTLKEPLQGLKHLGPIAIVGRERILRLAATPVSYVWQDIAVAGTIVLLASGPSEGKTTLLFLILAARMNLGEPVFLLGRRIDPAPQGKWTVIIEGEHSEASACRKLAKSVRLLGVDETALDRVILIARKAVRLGSPEWSDVVKLVAAGLVSDIAIDTVARVAPANSDDEREQAAIFDQVAQAIDAAPDEGSKPCVWACAHTRKNQTSGGLEDVSGSAQRTGQADTVLLLKGEKVDGRTVATRVTFAKLREDPDDYPLPVTFSIAPDAAGELAVTVAMNRSDDDRPLEARIIEQLHLGPKTKNALASTLGRSFKDIDGAISNLFDARSIRTTTVQVKGQDRKAFELRKDGPKNGSQSSFDPTEDWGFE